MAKPRLLHTSRDDHGLILLIRLTAVTTLSVCVRNSGVLAVCRNNRRSAFRGTGRSFADLDAARRAYRSAQMKAALDMVEWAAREY